MSLRALHRGKVVEIGGIKAKQCSWCMVTWPIDRYKASRTTRNGIQSWCERCRRGMAKC